MQPSELEYSQLSLTLAPYVARGLPESAAFLNWFLENIFRLDDVEARDVICDGTNDKGIDGIYADDLAEEIIVFQSKIRQNPQATLGDTDLKQFAGSMLQINTPEKIDLILSGNANIELKKLISAKGVRVKLAKGFALRGVFVSNSIGDHNARDFLSNHPSITLYDQHRIANEYVDLDLPDGINREFSFATDGPPLQLTVPSAAKLFLFAASAIELVQLPGISDGTLFAQNVRLSLGNTDVNKAIAATLKNSKEHRNFPLFHNGITLLAKNARYENDRVTVVDFVVVNGAQSLSAIFHEKSYLTSDLKLLLRVIEVRGNSELAKQITLRSNNQNAIKPRDLRSNHQLQLRLKAEFSHVLGGKYAFEIKRGETNGTKKIISNEEAGRLLLAFDLEEPWSCHQIYKVFDDFYTRIFGRPEVKATRIIFMNDLMEIVISHIKDIEHRLFATYTLTRFLIFCVLAKIIKADDVAASLARNPETILTNAPQYARFQEATHQILKGIIIDVNYETRKRAEEFDYKVLLKTQAESREFMAELTSSFEKDVARGKAETYASALGR